jgi:hypothetical protein
MLRQACFGTQQYRKSAESPSIGRENSNEIARDIARHSRDTERVLTVKIGSP